MDDGLGYNFFISLAAIITALLALAGSYGMYKLKEWGRQIIIVAAIVSFFVFAADTWYSIRHNYLYVPILVPLIVYVIFLYFLSREETIQLFS